MTIYTANEAADLLGISRRAVTAACTRGTLAATKHGSAWLITAAALDDYRRDYLRRPGRK